jgi:hypothetical protein
MKTLVQCYEEALRRMGASETQIKDTITSATLGLEPEMKDRSLSSFAPGKTEEEVIRTLMIALINPEVGKWATKRCEEFDRTN